jgi:sialate O-acetylesterase
MGARELEHSVLWNAMIYPFLNMTIKGAIWYQGESNAGMSGTIAEIE